MCTVYRLHCEQVSICTIYSSSGNLCIHYISAVRLAICWSGRNKRGLCRHVTNASSFYPQKIRMIFQAPIVRALYLYYWWQVSSLLRDATSAGCGCGDSGAASVSSSPSQWPVVPRSSTRPHCQHSLAAVVVSCTEAGHLFILVQWSSISLATLSVYTLTWTWIKSFLWRSRATISSDANNLQHSHSLQSPAVRCRIQWPRTTIRAVQGRQAGTEALSAFVFNVLFSSFHFYWKVCIILFLFHSMNVPELGLCLNL